MITTLHEMDSLEKHPNKPGIFDIVSKAIIYFPELNGVLYIGITRNNMVRASADVDNMLIRFNPKCKYGVRTVFHELMHLVQHNCEGFPKTEESCDIYSLARIPDDMINGNEQSSYVFAKNGKSDIENAKKALEYKKSGRRDYLRYFRELSSPPNKTKEQKESEKKRI